MRRLCCVRSLLEGIQGYRLVFLLAGVKLGEKKDISRGEVNWRETLHRKDVTGLGGGHTPFAENFLLGKVGSGMYGQILSLREQARVTNGWLRKRLETVLPEVMDREGFDMWIVSGREYNEGPVILNLLPQPVMAARGRTVLVFYRRPSSDPLEGVERLTLAAFGTEFYEAGVKPEDQGQWASLRRIVEERDPQCIGVNVSDVFAFGDGLSHSEYEHLMTALGIKYSERVKGAARLAVGYLEKRLPEEIVAYEGIVAICHRIIKEAFSPKVVHPGVTTPSDVVWWIRQTIHDLGLRVWFQPTVSIQRQDAQRVGSDSVIMPGDVLHCDVGFHYLGLACDVQQNAYVTKLGESRAPTGLEEALVTGNRMQDIVMGNMVRGRTGNEILERSLGQAKEQGISGMVYCHPVGYHGHGAGPTIGLFSQQGGVPGRGDYELFDDTCHALELNIVQEIPEWGGQKVRMALEEDMVFTGGKVYILDGRQEHLHII